MEAVDAGNRLLFRVNTKRGVAQPKPVKIPRPDRPTASGDGQPQGGKKRPATAEEMRAFFGGAIDYEPAGNDQELWVPPGVDTTSADE